MRKDLDDNACSFCKEKTLETIGGHLGLKTGHWCLGCLFKEAIDLQAGYTAAMKALEESLLMRGKEIESYKQLAQNYDELQEKYMNVCGDLIKRDLVDKPKGKK